MSSLGLFKEFGFLRICILFLSRLDKSMLGVNPDLNVILWSMFKVEPAFRQGPFAGPFVSSFLKMFDFETNILDIAVYKYLWHRSRSKR